MHENELPVDEALVRRLLGEQFPEWASLPLARVEPSGTVNAIYRLGDELAVRLPRLREWSYDERELEWLPRLAPLLPLRIPRPVARGAPTGEYPCGWLVVEWIDGDSGVAAPWDPLAAARDLAAFVGALQRVELDGPLRGEGRGVALAERDPHVRGAVERLGDLRAVAAWEDAVAAPAWDAAPLWAHGDLDARNWLVRGGRLVGVIDWGSFGVGDPAVDAMAAWKLHTAEAASVFRRELGVDDATWARARGWAVSQAAMALGYYTLESNAPLVLEARRWLELALDDYGSEPSR